MNAFAIHINAGNDTDGNPRRGWEVWFPSGGYAGFIPEGYDETALWREFPEATELRRQIPVTPAYYAKRMREAG
jgi:hypothetical protein